MGVTTFVATSSGKSGYISSTAFGKTAATTNTICGQTGTGFGMTRYRAYVNFDTSGGIPNKAVVHKMELLFTGRVTLSTSDTNPDDWKNSFNIGTFIGAALDITDWGGSSVEAVDYDWATNPSSPTTILLSDNACQYYNNSEDTDFEIIDSSDSQAGNGDWRYFMLPAGYSLKVYWHLPQVI